jgi:hypothetical protein
MNKANSWNKNSNDSTVWKTTMARNNTQDGSIVGS